MADFDLVLTGRVVLTDAVIDAGYVAIRNGLIERIGAGEPPAAAERHDFGQAYVMPGAIDAQVHSRSQKGQEDFVWSTRAAAAGGVTTIVDMPYDDGVLICTPERLAQKAAEASQQARVDFALYATVDPKVGASAIPSLAVAGAAGFKFSTFETHPDRFPRIPTPLLHDCFAAVAREGLIAGVHNENDETVRAAIAAVQASGRTDYRAHGLSRPAYTEALATAEVYELAAATGCSGHIVHCSIGRGYDMCAAYRAQGFDTTIEACIHYLILSEEDDVGRLGGKAKINPPVRGRAERDRLWHHLAAGNITVVSTDHVSWSEERKTDPDMLKNASGVPGLEVLYALLLKGLLDRDLSPSFAARLLAANPARLFRLGHRKGALELGRDADIVVMAHRPGRYDAAQSGHNIVQWSPYQGMDLTYRPVATFLRGIMVFDGKDAGAPGAGQFVRPAPAGKA
ncbi:MAG: dihydroorotase family protein [Pseudorhodoplanes sp.]|uniref:dihydroorotase n=1 Tax=Pseudorhodoplanes sp. TaxID=1934341 RepID=UPI003D1289BD